MGYQSETELEELLIKQLVEQGYERVKISDESDLKANFREKLFEYNKEKLNNTKFSDKEFKSILIYLEGKSIFRCAKQLRDKFVLERDDGSQAIVANPPYSANWSADAKFLNDDRFAPYGKLAPKSKADFAFVQHMIYELDENGTMAVVLPHGVLFRGAGEGIIRKYRFRFFSIFL